MKGKPKPYRPTSDWRDPNMPVLIFMADTNQLEAFPPREVTKVMGMWLDNNPEPHYTQDPTYNLRKKRSPKS